MLNEVILILCKHFVENNEVLVSQINEKTVTGAGSRAKLQGNIVISPNSVKNWGITCQKYPFIELKLIKDKLNNMLQCWNYDLPY